MAILLVLVSLVCAGSSKHFLLKVYSVQSDPLTAACRWGWALAAVFVACELQKQELTLGPASGMTAHFTYHFQDKAFHPNISQKDWSHPDWFRSPK